MPFFPVASGEFSPLWRMLDDYATHRTSPCELKPQTKSKSACSPATNAYHQPHFDIKEYDDRFELDGDLPGVAQSDIDIEFTDPQTLKISGHSARPKESNTAHQSAPNDAATTAEASQSHKATVEDEQMGEATGETSEADWTPVPTPSSTPVPGTDKHAQSQQLQPAFKISEPRYWLKERATGRFQRVFTFQSDRVDTENVKASLRDGVLRLVIPKAPEPAKVKINVQ